MASKQVTFRMIQRQIFEMPIDVPQKVIDEGVAAVQEYVKEYYTEAVEQIDAAGLDKYDFCIMDTERAYLILNSLQEKTNEY